MVTVGSFNTPGASVDLNWATSNHPFHTVRVAEAGAFYPSRDLAIQQARAAGQAVAELDRRIAWHTTKGLQAGQSTTQPPAPRRKLWEHLHVEHGLTLLDSELAEVVALATEVHHADMSGSLDSIPEIDCPYKKEPNEGTKESTHTCEECHWTNTNLTNLGEPGKPRWVCQGCLKRAIEQRDALADQTPQVDPPQLPSLTADLNTYSDHYLVSRAIECCMHPTRPLWAVVRDRFGLGSTSAKHLCNRFGFSSDDTKLNKCTTKEPTTPVLTAKPALGPRPAYIAAEFRIQELAQAIDRAATIGQVDLRLVDHACDLRNLVIEEAIRRNRGGAVAR